MTVQIEEVCQRKHVLFMRNNVYLLEIVTAYAHLT